MSTCMELTTNIPCSPFVLALSSPRDTFRGGKGMGDGLRVFTCSGDLTLKILLLGESMDVWGWMDGASYDLNP